MANMATLNQHDALDIVQDAMEKLVRHYSDKEPAQWPPLFYRILNHCIMDWHRKKKFRNLFFFWQQYQQPEARQHEEIFAGYETDTPDDVLIKSDDIAEMLVVIETLPAKQQQCFLLRCWQGFSVAKTADIMQCSQGSVKTHYFRATSKLKAQLESLNA